MIGPVLLGLGTNMGDRMRYLRRGLLALACESAVRVQRISPVFETEFVGEGRQAPYLNACAALESSLEPDELLATLKAIEAREGRSASGHMQPRPIDLDILLWDDKIISDAQLQVPHKGMRDRAFVMIPLAEIAPEKTFPDSGETIAQACANIRRKSGPWVRAYTAEKWLPTALANNQSGEKTEAWIFKDLALDDLDALDNLDLNKEEWRAALAVHCR